MRCASSSGRFKDSLCRLAAAIVLALTLSACGGGGGGDSPTPAPTPAVTTLSGVALDGYLHRAKVCLDVNGNGRCDAAELSTETAADGRFSLEAPETQASSAALIVEVIPNKTIDSDSPLAPVTQAMTLTAPIGSASIISPLTTLVAARMANGEGLDLARSAVSTLLGVPSRLLMADYVAGQGDADAVATHRVAVAVARVIVGIEAAVDPSSTSKSRLEALRNQVATTVVPRLAAIRSAQTLEDVRRAIDDAIFEETASYAVGGQVQGLIGSGLKLALAGVVIDIPAESQGFEFAAQQPAGADYQIQVVAQPSGQSCEIDNASGTVTEGLSERVVVRCQSASGRLSGTIAGLNAPGLELTNGADRVSIPLGASSFRFESQLNAGVAFAVQVSEQPAGQFCSVARGEGTMATEGVNDIQVTCSANAYEIGGVVEGLTAEGLQLTQGAETLSVGPGASSFQFSSRLAFGSDYSVVIRQQPLGLYCSLSNSAGTMGLVSLQSVKVSCKPEGQAYSVGGTVTGLAESGLVLRLGGETLNLSAGASNFQFANPIADGGGYAVTIETQPEFSSCSLLQGSGVVTGGNVTDVSVSCRARRLYALSSNWLDLIDVGNGQSSQRLELDGVTYTSIASAPRSPYVLVGDSFLRAIHVVDDQTGARHPASPVMVRATPAAVVVDPSGARAYLIDELANAVSVLDMSDADPRNWRTLDPVPVGRGPVAAYASTVLPHLYVVNRADQSVSVIHTGSLSVIRTYAGLGASPSAITAGPGETMLYIADEGGRTLIRLDLSNGRTTARDLNITRGALVRSPDGRRIFTLNEKYDGEDLFDTVTRLDTATWLSTSIDRLPTVTVGDSPLAIAISSGGSQIYTAELTEPSGVSIIDAGTMTVTKRIPLNIFPVGIVVK